jgi:16S rRNA (guanine1516-N2)-methyltransferase
MFPAKRKKSALPKKSMLVLRDLLGDDMDKDALFAAALQHPPIQTCFPLLVF